MFRKISPSLRLALLFLVFSGAWILLSDVVVAKLVGNNTVLLERIQSIKGLLFVSLCSILLFIISTRVYKNLSLSLKRSEELLDRYKALSKTTKEGIVDLDLKKDIAFINDQMKIFLNESSDIIEDFSIKNEYKIHPEDVSRILKNFNDTLNTGSAVWQADYRYLLNDGEYHDVINRGFILRDEKNQPVRLISALQDVSEIRNMRSVFYEQQISHKQMLGQSIIKAQERERNRWAEELHDNVCQLLTVVKLYLDHLSSEKVFSPGLINKIQEMVAKALDDIRQLSASIKPPEFSITTLNQAIKELISNVKRVKNLDFTFLDNDLDENLLNDEHKLMIYRVVQEQLSNILRYAEASKISIIISGNDQKAYVEIRDNGKGFDTEMVESGIGLRNIRSRLQIFSGSLEVISSPGEGCSLIAEFTI
jgi:two-component system, NarL family, sensor histidine kinase UhpB